MTLDVKLGEDHSKFLKDIAKSETPKNMELLLRLMEISGEKILSPKDRKGMNPMLIPLTIGEDEEKGKLCYMRWPTQREDMELQLVRTCNAGMVLESMSTDLMCRRIVAEMDFYGKESATDAVAMLNEAGFEYSSGDYIDYIKSGRFPTITEEDLRLVLDRYLLTKVGPFPDCYERLADNFLEKKDTISALVTCERAVSLFYGWGHPVAFHADMLMMIGRETEAKDAARAALGMPLWTVGRNKAGLERAATTAGFTGTEILGEMHAYRAAEERTEEIKEGLDPAQLALDQAAHLMDACVMGAIEGGWPALIPTIAEKYRSAGYDDVADFFEAYTD